MTTDTGQPPMAARSAEIREETGEEIGEGGWFAPGELPRLELDRFAGALLRATGHRGRRRDSRTAR